MPYINGLLKKKGLQQAVRYCYLKLGLDKTVEMLDSLKNLGFTYATRSGLSIGIDDLVIPEKKVEFVQQARDEVIKVEGQYQEGAITNGERKNKVIAIWSEVTETIADEMFGEMETLDKSGRNFNPVYVMADSGARGSKQQIRQLAGMRGLMAKPSGEIIETPDHVELPRRPDRAAVLHLDARRPQGAGRHRAQDGRLGLPDPPAGGRGPGRDHPRARLRHDGWAGSASPSSTRVARSSSGSATASSAASRSSPSSIRRPAR